MILSLGSNLGSREQNILGAVHGLRQEFSINVKMLSSLYETEPMGSGFSRAFINAVCIVETVMEPHELLRTCGMIEREFGREEKGGSRDRKLDIDIILYGMLVLNEPDLRIPHPRFRERLFVLAPLAEIAPGLRVPPDDVCIEEILDSIDRDVWVKRLSSRRMIF